VGRYILYVQRTVQYSTVTIWISSPGKVFRGRTPPTDNHCATTTTKTKHTSLFFASAAYLEHQTMAKTLIYSILQRGSKASSPLREIHQMPSTSRRIPMRRRKRRTLEQKSIKRVSDGYVFVGTFALPKRKIIVSTNIILCL
jgi:hypothetical protein